MRTPYHDHRVAKPYRAESLWRGGLTIALGLWAWSIGGDPDHFTWLDAVDLAIHETGHLLFSIGGELLTVAGGTLFQLAIPLVFCVSLWRRGDRHGATVPAWWAGQNLWNIARYAEDARAQDLPLVGGGEHDWTFLLDRFEVIEHDVTIGRWIRAFGTIVIVGSVLRGLWEAWRMRQPVPGP